MSNLTKFLISIIVILLIIYVILLFYKKYRNTPTYKGKHGETLVAKRLGRNIKNKRYVFNDYYIKVDNETTSQIDHILVNKKGIFVIETKNYEGLI